MESLNLKELIPLASPLLVVCGWLFIRKNAKIFAARAEANSIAKDIQFITDSIQDAAQKAWLTPRLDKNYPYEAFVLASLERVLTKTSILKKYCIEIDNEIFISYRKILTLNIRTQKTSHDNCHEHFVSILFETIKFNNHIDDLITRTKVSNGLKLLHKNPALKGIITSSICVALYFYLANNFL